MSRIKSFTISTEDVLKLLARQREDDPNSIVVGALRVCMELMQANAAIDPDSAMGDISAVMFLDTLGIYGSRIWMLYKDVCGESILKTIAVLRAVQLGLCAQRWLNEAIDGGSGGVRVDPDNMLAAVRLKLPNFGKEVADAAPVPDSP